jgi:choline dehydrogenase-like flavoprotein
VSTSKLDDTRRAVLRAFCDTVVPRVERSDDPDGFWARTATDLGVDAGIEELMGEMPEDVRAGLLDLLNAFEGLGITRVPSQLSREQVLRTVSLASSQAAAGTASLAGLTLFLAYGAADPDTGQNPNWLTLGYPGPLGAPPATAKPIAPLVPESDRPSLEAEVCVVGSGAGGAVIAGTLAQRGLKVVVLEAGRYRNEADFAQLELKGYQELYWRGGPTPTADGNLSLMAGATLGGGTVVNWTNCLRTPRWVREQWAREFGLEGVDGPDFDRHLDTVLERISATDACSDLNRPQKLMKAGCERLGWSFKYVVRNTDPACYAPGSAAYMGFGDQSGSKQSADKTFLLDAAEAGADIVVSCRADRILTEGGRASGVEATYCAEPGREAKLVVRAPQVVVACGSLESPALLLRTGIGGPAVGRYLRLHPSTATIGIHAEDQEAWWGAPHAGLSDEFADTGEGYGFLLEGTQYAAGLLGSAAAWSGGAEHKELMAAFRFAAPCISLTRDRGHGRVTIDHDGQAVPEYAVTDELDLANLRHGLEAQFRLHEAAGADQILSLAAGLPRWRRGEDLDEFIARARAVPMRAGGQRLFSAHQMGSCRMGSDPRTSVADPFGELHDTKGVWVGDASAFPTASGVNPMVSIMALAHRTAEAIAAVAERAGDESWAGAPTQRVGG